MVDIKIAFGTVRFGKVGIHKHKGQVRLISCLKTGGVVYRVEKDAFIEYLGKCVFYNREPVKEFKRVFKDGVFNASLPH